MFTAGTGDGCDYNDASGIVSDARGNYLLTLWQQSADSLQVVVLSDGITSIGDYMFWGLLSASDVDIPDSVTDIGYHAFDDTVDEVVTVVIVVCSVEA